MHPDRAPAIASPLLNHYQKNRSRLLLTKPFAPPVEEPTANSSYDASVSAFPKEKAPNNAPTCATVHNGI